MKKILSKLILAFSALIPVTAFAHEQWFGGAMNPLAPLPYFFTSWSVARIALIVGAVAILALAYFIRPFISRLKIAHKIEEKVTSIGSLAPQLVRSALGILLIMASSQSLLFAPDLNLTQVPFALAVPLWSLQYVIGFALVLGLFVRPAALLGIALYGASFAFFPARNLLSYMSFVGIFIYLFMVGVPGMSCVLFKNKLSKMYRWLAAHEQWGVIAMRVMFGLSFIYMGFAFKLLNPQLALNVVEKAPLNFIALLGITSFTNEMFVYAAGLAEVLFGIVYIFNILPRISSLKLFSLFTVTIFIFGLGELFGHLPLLAGFFTILTYQKKES